ncbi:response regulator [Legionella micdadei]|uniref:CheY chemotaxis protein or a CheY-like REC (Receiver) domain n=2 Tax=Legionella micdadei TaxID=451 RepID=A0A098GE16_LEGMI|nr:response regulator [Legionella micdadei]ARG97696.1 response regulator [Legionella micdadei]KTD27789.1 sensory histidine-kinase / response regulator [Legionella micdadei]NSL17773.1 response regulator [Legionella micdadei]CEG60724.1 Sensory box histidine kinase/response regulator [Legionella micdadei]SCY11217.1 CheY chemotaxis protein or a CheY-like REC (receiver) domain [Legionella micdadei]
MAAPLHVLVVEDSPVAQTVAKFHLIKLGCIVDLAENGDVALAKSRTIKYDLILMDIGLGNGPDGFEVTSKIKQPCEVNQTTPIMAVTAHGESEYIDKAFACGMARYFNKPITPTTVKEIVDYLKVG